MGFTGFFCHRSTLKFWDADALRLLRQCQSDRACPESDHEDGRMSQQTTDLLNSAILAVIVYVVARFGGVPAGLACATLFILIRMEAINRERR